MRKLIISALAGVALGASASTPVNLQGVEFTADTLTHYIIGPGVSQTSLTMKSPSGRVVKAYVVTMDRSQATGMDIKVDVGRDSCKTAEAITSIAKRKTTEDTQYLAGINGDFFITSSFAAQHEFGNAILGYPNMSCATQGKLVAPDMIDITSRENALIVTTEGDMYIDATDFKYRVLDNSGDIKIDAKAVNYPRRANEMVVYNSYNGGWTKTDNTGRELVLKPAEGAKWAINKSVKFLVDGGWRQGGNSKIPEDGIVISLGPDYTNKNIDFLNNLKDGDVVKLKIVCSLPAFDALKPSISEICGGDVRILNNNVTTTQAIRWINSPGAQYSRSLVGYSQDHNLFVMCAVDAGDGSSGVTYYEAADLMRALGCWDALDLDGGGSTAIWTHNAGIFNHLRDGSERAVGNGIFLRLNAPRSTEIKSIRFADHAIALPKYGLYRPVIFGYNEYGQLIDTDVKGFTLTADKSLGSVTEDGGAILADGAGTHALTATMNGMTSDIAVTVDASKPAEPRITSILLDQLKPWTIELDAQVGNNLMSVAPQAYTWTSSDPEVASVDAMGVVSGLKNGTTTITGTVGTASVSIAVTVECATEKVRPIESTPFVKDEWSVKGTSVTTSTVVATPFGETNGFDLTFRASSSRGPSISLSKDIRIWSKPDAIEVTLNPLDSELSKISVNVQPANASRYITYAYSEPLQANSENKITIPVSAFGDADDFGMYPLTFKSIAIAPVSKTGEYHIQVPCIAAVYNGASGVQDIVADTEYSRLTVRQDGDILSVPFVCTSLEIYDISGRLVSRASNVSTIPAPPRGIYIVRADSRTAKVQIK